MYAGQVGPQWIGTLGSLDGASPLKATVGQGWCLYLGVWVSIIVLAMCAGLSLGGAREAVIWVSWMLAVLQGAMCQACCLDVGRQLSTQGHV